MLNMTYISRREIAQLYSNSKIFSAILTPAFDGDVIIVSLNVNCWLIRILNDFHSIPNEIHPSAFCDKKLK